MSERTNLHTEFQAENAPHPFEPVSETAGAATARPSLVVKGVARSSDGAARPARRTVAPKENGLSVAEMRMLSESVHHMRSARLRPKQRLRKLIGLTLEAHDEGEERLRGLSRRLKSDVIQIHARAGSPRWLQEVLESRPHVHAHIVTPVPAGCAATDIIERLKGSSVYGGDRLHGCLLHDAESAVHYLSKEATTQAHYAAGFSFPRKKGRHPLGVGGGDRVRPSKALEADMIADGKIEPRQRTYAKRALTAETRRQAKVAQSPKPKPTFDVIEGGQLALFPTRTPSRLRYFAHGLMPPAVAREVEFHRARLGLTQTQLAARIGIKQPQLSNVLRGHDPMAAWVVTRLREALLGAGSGDGGPPVALAA